MSLWNSHAAGTSFRRNWRVSSTKRPSISLITTAVVVCLLKTVTTPLLTPDAATILLISGVISTIWIPSKVGICSSSYIATYSPAYNFMSLLVTFCWMDFKIGSRVVDCTLPAIICRWHLKARDGLLMVAISKYMLAIGRQVATIVAGDNGWNWINQSKLNMAVTRPLVWTISKTVKDRRRWQFL